MLFITYSTLTDKALTLPPEEATKAYAKTMEIAAAFGGKFLNVWATSGRFDFVTIAEYPDFESGFKARTKILELGLFHLETDTLYPVESFIKAMADTRVAVAV